MMCGIDIGMGWTEGVVELVAMSWLYCQIQDGEVCGVGGVPSVYVHPSCAKGK